MVEEDEVQVLEFQRKGEKSPGKNQKISLERNQHQRAKKKPL